MARKKIPQNIAIRADLSERLDSFLKRPLAPTKTKFWETALERLLDEEEGKDPPKLDQD